MMYQRDIAQNLSLYSCLTFPPPAPPTGGSGGRSAEEAQQLSDRGREGGVDAEEEDGEQAGHNDDHDRGGDRFLAARPDDLRGLCADLGDELAGGDFCHCQLLLELRIEKRPADLSGRRGCGSLSDARPSLQAPRHCRRVRSTGETFSYIIRD